MANSYTPKRRNQIAETIPMSPLKLEISRTSNATKRIASPNAIKVEPLTICKLKGFNLKHIFLHHEQITADVFNYFLSERTKYKCLSSKILNSLL